MTPRNKPLNHGSLIAFLGSRTMNKALPRILAVLSTLQKWGQMVALWVTSNIAMKKGARSCAARHITRGLLGVA